MRNLLFVNPMTGRAFSLDQDTGTVRSMETQGDLTAFAKALVGGETTKEITARDAYHKVAPVYRAVAIRCKSASAVPYTIKRGTINVFDSDVPETKLPDDLKMLTHLSTKVRLMEAALCLTGKVRIHKENPRGKRQTTHLRWYDPTTFSVDDDDIKESTILYYTRTTPRGVVKIPAEEIFAIDYPDPFVELGAGTPPSRSALGGADVLHNYTTFIAGQLRGGNIGNFYVSVQSPDGRNRPPGEAAEVKLKRDLFRMFRRRGAIDKPEDVPLFSQAVQHHNIGSSIEEITSEHLTKEHWRWVATAFGIPAGMMFENAANYATMMLQKYELYETEVFPDLRLIQDHINEELLAPLNYTLTFEMTRLEAVQFAEVQKAQALQLLTGGRAIISVEEARKELGKEGTLTPALEPGGDGMTERSLPLGF